MKTPPRLDALRAAKLSRIPGMTIDEVTQRFGVSHREVARARRDPSTAPTLRELALAALTHNGCTEQGSLTDLTGIARWLDYLNHDGCTVADVRALLIACPELEITGEQWRLRAPWP